MSKKKEIMREWEFDEWSKEELIERVIEMIDESDENPVPDINDPVLGEFDSFKDYAGSYLTGLVHLLDFTFYPKATTFWKGVPVLKVYVSEFDIKNVWNNASYRYFKGEEEYLIALNYIVEDFKENVWESCGANFGGLFELEKVINEVYGIDWLPDDMHNDAPSNGFAAHSFDGLKVLDKVLENHVHSSNYYNETLKKYGLRDPKEMHNSMLPPGLV